MYKILHNHIRKLLDEFNRNNEGTDRIPCNSRIKDERLLDGRCNSENEVYLVCIFTMQHKNDGERIYIGISAGNWKEQLYYHRHSFPNQQFSFLYM